MLMTTLTFNIDEISLLRKVSIPIRVDGFQSGGHFDLKRQKD